MPIKTVSELFIHEISDTYSAEKQMTRSLPKMAKAATDPQLATAFETHLEETRNQVERIEQVAELCGFKLKRIKCDGMEGLIEEATSTIDQVEGAGARRRADWFGSEGRTLRDRELHLAMPDGQETRLPRSCETADGNPSGRTGHR